jgi:hypothetical protein
MTVERQLDSENQSSPETISEAASDWLYQFLKHFETNFIDASQLLPSAVGRIDLLRSTLVAIFQTLEDAGFSREEAFAWLTEVPGQPSAEPINWTPEMNARRFELIDKQIADALSLNERVELARLTQAMRRVVDSEANLPMEGARQLHRTLQQLRTGDQELRQRPR